MAALARGMSVVSIVGDVNALEDLSHGKQVARSHARSHRLKRSPGGLELAQERHDGAGASAESAMQDLALFQRLPLPYRFIRGGYLHGGDS